jgi:TM2 domain-containing membrane protein YozV
MTAQTFGRKGVIGEPAQKRAGLVAHQPRSFQPAERDAAPADEVETRRAAFLAAEHVRKEERAEAQTLLSRWKPESAPADRTLKAAYLAWFFLGLVGGHRFYLRRPITGAIQGLLFSGCLAAVFLQYYQAFFGLALSWLWMLGDGFLIRFMFRKAAAT